MKLRITIILFILNFSSGLCGAADNKLDAREAMQLFTQTTGTFNIGKSIAKGINEQELPALEKRIEKTNEILLNKHQHDRQIFEKQTLAPLRGAFNFIKEKVTNYHQLYQTLVEKEDYEWDENKISDLAKLFENKPDLSSKLYNQVVKQGNTATLSAMAALLMAAQDDKNRALLLAIKSTATRNMIGLADRQKLLVELIEQDIQDPSQFKHQLAVLGRIIKNISAQARNNLSSYPETWTNSIQMTAWGILKNPVRDTIYEKFRNVFNQKNTYTINDDLEKILNEHQYTDIDEINGFVSELERYKYQLENYRLNTNITWGLSRFSDAARYKEHLDITTKLLQHLRDIYPSTMSDLDKQIQLQGAYDPFELLILMRASGLEAVILSIIHETKEMRRAYIELEFKSQKNDDDNGWNIL